MKNVMKSVLVAVTVGFCATSASAVTLVQAPVLQTPDSVVVDTLKKEVPPMGMYLAQVEVTYTVVELAALPQNIKEAVTAKYAKATIEEAFVGSDGVYKLVIKDGDNKLTVFFNKDAEFVKEEAVKTEQTIMLG